MEQLRFSIPEILSLIGVAQCVYILVYMFFRAGKLSRAGLPIAYFMTLALAFLSDFAASASPGLLGGYYFYLQWTMWFLGPPLSVLLVAQIAQISRVPKLRQFWVLGLVPVAFFASLVVSGRIDGCARWIPPCAELEQWLTLSGLVAGGISLLAIWGGRDIIGAINDRKTGKQRYWLILALIIANIFLLLIMLGSLSPFLTADKTIMIRTILGLAFIYLVNTSLLRIYPQAVHLSEIIGKDRLSHAEREIAEKIENLLRLEKVYHEPSYSRTDLARECAVADTAISRIINLHFGKSFPQLLNEHRIEDAKQLLRETDAAVKVVAEEVGFNSLASFNRVFKEMTGLSPTQYRTKGAQ